MLSKHFREYKVFKTTFIINIFDLMKLVHYEWKNAGWMDEQTKGQTDKQTDRLVEICSGVDNELELEIS